MYTMHVVHDTPIAHDQSKTLRLLRNIDTVL